jgi:hypothetical protein
LIQGLLSHQMVHIKGETGLPDRQSRLDDIQPRDVSPGGG